MLRRANGLIGAKIHALDGDLGQIDDFYFDDLEWKIRYMIARTGSWFAEKHVMLSPSAIRDVIWDEHAVYVDLTQEQIKQSPDLDMQKPVTREQELELARHYHWPSYWQDWPARGVGSSATSSTTSSTTLGLAATGIPGMGVAPLGVGASDVGVPDHIANDISSTGISDEGQLRREVAKSETLKVEAELDRAVQAEGLHHYLRGVKEVTGYHIAATDGEIGHVDDFFVDEENWQIHYLLIDTGNWLPGRKVLVSPAWIDDIFWKDSQVHVKATRQQIKSSPEYDPHQGVDRHYEGRLYEHYGYPPYWT